ncbi:hypothetical protein GY45DRAFT_1439071 [Cubamyces sp. BRFM 1775]|nr:hypothetical protein GY45DRAFT_1439071 [Cubamyces sp. BRFM 1775]
MSLALRRSFRVCRSGLHYRSPAHYKHQRHLHLGPQEERELFSVTTSRWLYNDEQQRAVRYVPFDVQAFVDTAVKAANAKSCLSIEKIYDGSMNRVFELKLDNGVALIAKIPFPVAGPKHYCTASEVATMDYLHAVHGFHVPQVLAWCSRAETTPVGTEYIIYEKLPGVPLREHDNNDLPLQDDPYISQHVLPRVQKVQSFLYRIGFTQIGSLYYKEDVHPSLRDRPLYKNGMKPPGAERFCIGPTVDREFWRAGRAALDIDRGPWSDMHSYLRAFAECARASVDAYPNPSIDDKYRRLISDYERLIPHIAPKELRYILWHPDLSDGNLLVTETTQPCELLSVIDWQSTVIAPEHMQLRTPPAYNARDHPLINYPDDLEMPTLRPEAESLEDEQKQLAARALRKAHRKKAHEIYVREADPELGKEMYDMICSPGRRVITSPATTITRGVEDGLEAIEYSFLHCRTLWPFAVEIDDKGTPLIPFPIEISEDEEKRIKEQRALRSQDEEMANPVLEQFGVLPESEGEVGAEEYEAAKRAAEEARQAVLDAAPTPEERERRAQAWPLQDGKVTWGTQLCC